MGFAITLIATPVQQRDALLAASGVGVSDTPDPDLSQPVSAGVVGDHFVIWHNLRSYKAWKEPDPVAMTQGAEGLFLTIVDTAGAQVLSSYKSGSKVWSVSFTETNDNFLASEGPVPIDPMDMVKELAAEHPELADEDPTVTFGENVPAQIFERLTGFRYDGDTAVEFFKLTGDLPQFSPSSNTVDGIQKKPWWKFW